MSPASPAGDAGRRTFARQSGPADGVRGAGESEASGRAGVGGGWLAAFGRASGLIVAWRAALGRVPRVGRAWIIAFGRASGVVFAWPAASGRTSGRGSAWRSLGGVLLLALAGAAHLAAQLPAPPASARSPLRIGGYGTLVLGRTEAIGAADGTTPASPAGSAAPVVSASPRDGIIESTAALIVSGTLAGRFSYLGELDGANRTWQNWPGRRDDRSLEVDRLYAELSLGDALRLRAGRFLTPIGQWNEIHADPLTWSTQRPLTTYRPFAKSVTGAMAAGEVSLAGHDAGYAVFVAPFRAGYAGEETAFVKGAGGRVAVELLPNLYIGASTARFRASWPYSADEDAGEQNGGETGSGDGALLPRGDALDGAGASEAELEPREQDSAPRRLYGGDLSWSYGRAELLAEAVAISAGAGHPSERGGFVQAALPIVRPLHLVLRTEMYDPVVREPLRIQTIGAVLRPTAHLTMKLERQFTDRPSARAPEGWFVSGSAMF